MTRRSLAMQLLLGAALTGAAVCPMGCGGDADRSKRASGVLPSDFEAWTPARSAFMPRRLRVHPLTRLTRDPSGDAVLACHVELRDEFGQVVRCLGVVQVELLHADAQGDIEGEPVRVWQIDLRDPEKNAAAFDDVVTRTYALRLGALPHDAAQHADSSDDAVGYGVRVRFLFKDDSGEARQMDAEASIASP